MAFDCIIKLYEPSSFILALFIKWLITMLFKTVGVFLNHCIVKPLILSILIIMFSSNFCVSGSSLRDVDSAHSRQLVSLNI